MAAFPGPPDLEAWLRLVEEAHGAVVGAPLKEGLGGLRGTQYGEVGIGHTSWVLAQRPSLGVMVNP